jgi:hypothetical protein
MRKDGDLPLDETYTVRAAAAYTSYEPQGAQQALKVLMDGTTWPAD